MHSCQLINLLTLHPGPRLWTVSPPPMALANPSSNSSEAGAKFLYVCVCDVWTPSISAFSCSYVKVLEMKRTIYPDFDGLMQEDLA